MADATAVQRRSRPLSADEILDAASTLLEQGPQDFSLRQLGDLLGVHNTAVYRHFRDKNELLRAAADRVLTDVPAAADGAAEPFAGVVSICLALRDALLARPAAARVLAQGPARRTHELRLTERVLGLLREAGLPAGLAVDAYHALVEYVVGASVIDQDLASRGPAEREDSYRRWRADYLGLDASQFPNLVELAPSMYHGADAQFEFGLRLMVDSLRRMAEDAS